MITKSLTAGRRVYAVGDIHGCDDRLAALHGLIAEDLARRPAARPLLIHLGDYIDRGPASAAVLARIGAPPAGAPGLAVVNLMGNHEDMLLTALAEDDREAARHWLANGGGETLASWGLNWRDPPRVWAEAMPPRQLGLLRGLELSLHVGGYLFVHAGIRPGVALEAQKRHDLLWIREPFLSHEGRLPAVVVHGHTPSRAPEVLPHRIGVDTGAVLGGDLTCTVLEDNDIRFLRA